MTGCTKSPVITRTCVYSSYIASLFWGGFLNVALYVVIDFQTGTFDFHSGL